MTADDPDEGDRDTSPPPEGFDPAKATGVHRTRMPADEDAVKLSTILNRVNGLAEITAANGKLLEQLHDDNERNARNFQYCREVELKAMKELSSKFVDLIGKYHLELEPRVSTVEKELVTLKRRVSDLEKKLSEDDE